MGGSLRRAMAPHGLFDLLLFQLQLMRVVDVL